MKPVLSVLIAFAIAFALLLGLANYLRSTNQTVPSTQTTPQQIPPKHITPKHPKSGVTLYQLWSNGKTVAVTYSCSEVEAKIKKSIVVINMLQDGLKYDIENPTEMEPTSSEEMLQQEYVHLRELSTAYRTNCK